MPTRCTASSVRGAARHGERRKHHARLHGRDGRTRFEACCSRGWTLSSTVRRAAAYLTGVGTAFNGVLIGEQDARNGAGTLGVAKLWLGRDVAFNLGYFVTFEGSSGSSQTGFALALSQVTSVFLHQDGPVSDPILSLTRRGRLVARSTALPQASVARTSAIGTISTSGQQYPYLWNNRPAGYGAFITNTNLNQPQTLFPPANPPSLQVSGLSSCRCSTGWWLQSVILPWGPAPLTNEDAGGTDDYSETTLFFRGGDGALASAPDDRVDLPHGCGCAGRGPAPATGTCSSGRRHDAACQLHDRRVREWGLRRMRAPLSKRLLSHWAEKLPLYAYQDFSSWIKRHGKASPVQPDAVGSPHGAGGAGKRRRDGSGPSFSRPGRWGAAPIPRRVSSAQMHLDCEGGPAYLLAHEDDAAVKITRIYHRFWEFTSRICGVRAVVRRDTSSHSSTEGAWKALQRPRRREAGEEPSGSTTALRWRSGRMRGHTPRARCSR